MPESQRRIKYYTLRNLDRLPQFNLLTQDQQFAMRVVGHVLPFRVNNYVTNELIDWSCVPDDPIFQLTLAQQGMLLPQHFKEMAGALRRGATQEEVDRIATRIRLQLNPHPAGQLTNNTHLVNGTPIPGLQHKYRETCLVFPAAGQTCHSYCTFCFRWPQFVNLPGFKFATKQARQFQNYIRRTGEITDVLFTGGDPMVMNARKLATYIEPLLQPGFEHVRSIRIGTKSIAYWPYRYLTDRDAEDILRLFERVVRAGKHLAIMAHFNHWKELSTPAAQRAIHRIRSTGAEIRTQSPLVRHINDDPDVWARMWTEQVSLGCIPYYMFVVRNTGAMHYFSIPLVKAWRIYQKAYQQVSGLGRTVRGPSMSADAGKVEILGVSEVLGQKVFNLTFLQARNPGHVRRPFFARFDPDATWLSDLVPAFGKARFFFEDPSHGQSKYSSNGRETASVVQRIGTGQPAG